MKGDNTPLTMLGWKAAGWAMRLMFFVMPRGTARDRLGHFVHLWCAECRLQWAARYGEPLGADFAAVYEQNLQKLYEK